MKQSIEIDPQIAQYIDLRLAPFKDPKLVLLVKMIFHHIQSLRAHDSCMSISTSLAVGMQYLGYDSRLIVGTLQDENGYIYDHAWVVLNNRIFDIAGYGNSNWSPYYLGIKWKYPIINEQTDSLPFLYKEITYLDCTPDFIFYEFLNRSISTYFDNNPHGAKICWINTCSYLHVSPNTDSFRKLREIADKMIIGVPDSTDAFCSLDGRS